MISGRPVIFRLPTFQAVLVHSCLVFSVLGTGMCSLDRFYLLFNVFKLVQVRRGSIVLASGSRSSLLIGSVSLLRLRHNTVNIQHCRPRRLIYRRTISILRYRNIIILRWLPILTLPVIHVVVPLRLIPRHLPIVACTLVLSEFLGELCRGFGV